MSRIESGRISLRLDWHDVNDLFHRATRSLKQELEPFRLVIAVPDDMPLVRIDLHSWSMCLINIAATPHNTPGLVRH
jgi:K+-sensing histidine kinase KdpD